MVLIRVRFEPKEGPAIYFKSLITLPVNQPVQKVFEECVGPKINCASFEDMKIYELGSQDGEPVSAAFSFTENLSTYNLKNGTWVLVRYEGEGAVIRSTATAQSETSAELHPANHTLKEEEQAKPEEHLDNNSTVNLSATGVGIKEASPFSAFHAPPPHQQSNADSVEAGGSDLLSASPILQQERTNGGVQHNRENIEPTPTRSAEHLSPPPVTAHNEHIISSIRLEPNGIEATVHQPTEEPRIKHDETPPEASEQTFNINQRVTSPKDELRTPTLIQIHSPSPRTLAIKIDSQIQRDGSASQTAELAVTAVLSPKSEKLPTLQEPSNKPDIAILMKPLPATPVPRYGITEETEDTEEMPVPKEELNVARTPFSDLPEPHISTSASTLALLASSTTLSNTGESKSVTEQPKNDAEQMEEDEEESGEREGEGDEEEEAGTSNSADVIASTEHLLSSLQTTPYSYRIQLMVTDFNHTVELVDRLFDIVESLHLLHEGVHLVTELPQAER